MGLERTKDWAYPAQIEDIKDVDTYLRHHFEQHVEESQSRIEDFESLEIDTLTVTDWTIQTSFKPSADNSVDLAATTLRFKDLYLAGNLKDDTVTLTVANAKSAYTHVSATGADHGYINQDVQSSASPAFAALGLGTGELTAGSINRASGTMTMEIGGSTVQAIEAGVVSLGYSDTAKLSLIDASLAEKAKFELDGNSLLVDADGSVAIYPNNTLSAIFTPEYNFGLNTSVFGTSAVHVFGMGAATAPTTSPANMTQLWSEDRGGNAGYAQLHYRTESGKARPLVREFDVSDYGLVPDDSGGSVPADNVTAWNALIGDVAAGDTIYFPKGTWYVNDDLAVSQEVTIYGNGEGSIIRQTGTSKAGFVISVDNVTVRDLQLYGRQYATPDAGENAIEVTGTNNTPAAPTFLKGIRIYNCTIKNWGFYGIVCRYISDFSICNNYLENNYQADIMLMSSRRCKINYNDIYCAGVYAIQLTFDPDDKPDTEQAAPRCEDCVINGNNTWGASGDALGTHGGKNLIFSNNIVIDAITGIVINDDDSLLAPQGCIVSNNRIINNTLGHAEAIHAVAIYGYDTGARAQDTLVIGNVIENYGDDTSITGCAIADVMSDGTKITNNIIRNSGTHAIFFYQDNLNFEASHNTIDGIRTDGVSGYAIRQDVIGSGNSGLISYNIIDAGTEVGITLDNDEGTIRVEYNDITTSGNEIENHANAKSVIEATGGEYSFMGNILVGRSDTARISLLNADGAERAFLQLEDASGVNLRIDADSGISLYPSNTLAATFAANGKATFKDDITVEGSVFGETNFTSTTARVVLKANTESATGYLDFNGNPNDITIPENSGYFRVMEYNSVDELFRVTAAGEVTKPNQPAFLAHNSVPDADVTGDNTPLIVEFDTEIFDQGGNFDNATDTFTAPVTGKYLLNASVMFGNLDADTYESIGFWFWTSNRLYAMYKSGLDYAYGTDGNLTVNATIVADMDANDTVYIWTRVVGGVKEVSVEGGESLYTYFTGALVC